MPKAKRRDDTLAGILFLLPNFLGFAVFMALPVIAGFVLGFTDYDGFERLHFLGLSNFADLLGDDYFLVALKNNLVYAATSVPLTIAAALGLALAIKAEAPGREAFKTIFFFPTISSMVAIAIVWSLLLHPTMGPVNGALRALGVANPPGWLVSQRWAMPSVIFVTVWKCAGYYMVMIFAGLQAIPRQLYEAAEIDGAGRARRFANVTWPMLSPTMFLVTVLAIINSFQVFDLVYIMTQGGPGRATNVLVLRIYQEGFRYMRFGYASAEAFVLFLVILAVTLAQFKGQRKWVTYME
jgi:multiple sugar transport system permease protein